MTAILAVVNQKGGVGKTTTAVTFAHGLAIEGQRVLLIDLDPQGQVATSLGLRKEAGLYRLLVKGAGARAVSKTGRANLWAVLGDKQTVVARREINAMYLRIYTLRRALKDLDYNTIILDTAPGADILQVNALCACTHFLIPVELDHLALQGAADTLATVASLKELDALDGRFLGVLPTMWKRTTTHTREQFEVLRKQFGNLLWPPIPDDTKAREATLEGRTLWEYAPICRALSGASTSNGLVGGYIRAVERLMEEICGTQ